jgi:hypothetical protein
LWWGGYGICADEWADVTVPKKEATGLVVEVTQQHIDNGCHTWPTDFKCDPTSMAVRDAAGASFAMCSWGYADSFKDNIKTSWSVRYADCKIIQKWDEDWRKGLPVKPFSFVVYKVREVDKTPKQFKGKPRRHMNYTDGQIRMNLK